MKKMELEAEVAKSEAGSAHGDDSDDERSEHDEADVSRQSPRKSGPKLPFFMSLKTTSIVIFAVSRGIHSCKNGQRKTGRFIWARF